MRVQIGPEHTAYVGHDDEWYYGWCLEVPGAEGQGRTVRECIESIRQSIRAIEQKRDQRAKTNPPRLP